MALIIDAANRRFVLDVTAITATEIYSRWADWAASSDNAKYLPAFAQVGGNDLGSSLSIPPYFFLLNGWRVRPLEGNHTLIITGNLFVDGGGVPVVPTLGAFNVSVQYTVPVQAQVITTGSGSSATPAQIAEAVMNAAADSGLSLRQAQRVILAALAGKASGFPSGAQKVFRDVADTRNVITAVTDANGNRTAVTLDPGS